MIKVLKEIGEINFPPKVDQIIMNEWIGGKGLTKMSIDVLMGLGIPAGPAVEIVHFVGELK